MLSDWPAAMAHDCQQQDSNLRGFGAEKFETDRPMSRDLTEASSQTNLPIPVIDIHLQS